MTQRIVRQIFEATRAALPALLLVACGGDKATTPPAVSYEVSLLPTQYTAIAGAAIQGAVRFPVADAAGAEYLVVGQLASGQSDMNGNADLGGASLVSARGLFEAPAPSPALAFHGALRRREAELARVGALRGFLRVAPAPRTAPPVVGQQRTFKVCSNLDCTSTKNVPATVQWVGTHAAIFVDDSNPAPGFSAGNLSALGSQFDTVLYPIDTDRFGAESDIDGNTVVLVLLTRLVNALTPKPQCSTSYVTGYFFGADIQPGFASQYNNGEVFYGMVPDPGSATSCAFTASYVSSLLPVTFIHEFQHMISFNQHVLVRGGPAEVLWLNEAMSHLAEEIGGLHYDSLNDATTKSHFQFGDVYNAYAFLRAPNTHALLTDNPPGSLEERGAGWLFLRYLTDQFGPTITRSLEQTALTDVANVRSATGNTPIESLLTRWALAMYVDDLPSFTAPAALKYTSWNFRTTFASLHSQDPTDFPLAWPLTPDSSLGSAVQLTAPIKSGSPAYVLPRQQANASAFDLTFRVTFSGSTPPGGGGPQLSLIRLH
jgi:hypothetical protein